MSATRAQSGSLLGALAAVVLLLLSCASSAPSPTAQEWYDLGNAWLDKGEWKRAGQAYARALALNPSFSGASFNLARALIEAGDYDGALGAIASLSKRDPGNVRLISARAYALYKKGDAKAALAAYREALKLDPYAPDAVYDAALLELEAGEAAAAAADLDRLTTAKPDDGQAFVILGRAREKLALSEADSAPRARGSALAAFERSKALAAYEKAEALGKADADALERLAALYGQARRYPEEMTALEATVKADPKRGADWFTLARLRLVVAADSDKGLAELKSALDAGFADKDAAGALLAEPDLVERAKVLDLLKAKGLSN